jgi:hypothetical protein
VKARDEAQNSAWNAKWLADRQARHMPNNAQYFHDALRLIADGHNDPRTIATETLAEFERTYPK